MKNKKVLPMKIVAICLAAVIMTGLLAACGDTSYIMTVGDKKYPVGPYAFYAHFMRDSYDMQYYYYYQTRLVDIMNNEIDENGTKLYESINSAVENQYLAYVVISEKFDELGLSLTDEQKAELDTTYQTNYVESYGATNFAEILTKLGLTESEFKDLLSVNYKNSAIVDYYFGVGGQYEVFDSEMRSNFQTNYSRFKYIVLYKTDSDENQLTTDEIIGKYDKAKEAVAKLDGGAAIEDLIPEYSDDYYSVEDYPADATEETIASYEAQNLSIKEDGIVTDKTGIFNKLLYSYYGYTMDTAIVDYVFGAAEGDYKLIELTDAYWIVKKVNVMESDKYYETWKDTVFDTLTATDVSNLYNTWKNAMAYVFNDAAVKQYDIRGLDEMFTQLSATGSDTSGTAAQ